MNSAIGHYTYVTPFYTELDTAAYFPLIIWGTSGVGAIGLAGKFY